jgi:catechol 2,3-dioxygenase
MNTQPKSLSLGHLGIFVHDLSTMVAFYERVLGYVESDRGVVRGMKLVFLSRDPRAHHQIVLVEGRAGGSGKSVLNQVSLRLDSLAELRALARIVADDAEATDTATISHGNAWSLYFHDPEGNRIEVFVDSPWYVAQPVIEPLDLSMSDDEIHAHTRAAFADNPSFRPVEEWRAEFARKLAAAHG